MRARIVLAIGVVMCLIGAYVALRPLWDPRPRLGSRWADMAAAAFLLVRGGMNVRVARRIVARDAGAAARR